MIDLTFVKKTAASSNILAKVVYWFPATQADITALALNSVTEELREAEYRGEEEGDGTEPEGEAHAPLAHLVLPAPLAARREALVRRHL